MRKLPIIMLVLAFAFGSCGRYISTYDAASGKAKCNKRQRIR